MHPGPSARDGLADLTDSVSSFIHQAAIAVGLGLTGFCVLALNSWLSPRARRSGARAHWARGFVLNGIGMILIAASWGVLAFQEPRVHSDLLRLAGLGLGVASGALYAAARRVGRLKPPSSYSLELDTFGVYRAIRHPQALALCLVVVALAALTGSIPLMLTTPLWILGWTVYTYFEEAFELVPAFGERYLRYREQTPRLLPRFKDVARLLRDPEGLRERRAD